LRSGSGPQRTRLLVYGLEASARLQLTPLLHCLRRRFAQAELILLHPHSLLRCLFADTRNIDAIVSVAGSRDDALAGCALKRWPTSRRCPLLISTASYRAAQA